MSFRSVKSQLCSVFVLSLLLSFSPDMMAQTVITGSPGYTDVNNPAGTTVYNITSNKQFNGGTAILNRFTSFVLDNNHTANIILGAGVQTSVNVVNNPLGTPTTINGTLNHIAGVNSSGPIGGNFIFIDPNGFMVGSSGQINAGSILLSTANRTFASFVGGGQINLNSAAQDNLLNTNVVDINGKFSFYDMSGAAQIDGVLNTMSGNAPAGISPAVSVFANAINLGATGMILARNQTATNLVTAKNVSYTFSNNSTTILTALDNGGNLAIAGQVKSIDGKVLISANTLDLVNNALNITGIVDASSLTHDSRGDIRLRNGISEQSSGEISLDNAQVSASNDINIYTRKAVNINGAGTILNAGNDLIFTGNGMYLNGTYKTTQGDININNSGANPLLIDADLTAQSGDININTDGPLVLDYAESLLAASVVPVDDQISMASGNVSITSNGFTSYASIISQGGNVSIESVGDAAFTGHCGINAFDALNVLANTILVNQPFNAINGNLELDTRTGDIFLGANGMLSSLNGAVNIFRKIASGELKFTANGIISAENVANGLVVGDTPCGSNNGGPVVLDGSTFGVYSGTYNSSTVVPKNAQFNKNMYVNNFAVNIYGTTPSPVNPKPNPGGGDTASDNTSATNSSSTNTNNDDNDFAFTDITVNELVENALGYLDAISDPATHGTGTGWNRFSGDIQGQIGDRVQQGIVDGLGPLTENWTLPEDQMLSIYKDVLGDTNINWINFFSSEGDTYSFDSRNWDEYSKALKEHILVTDRDQAWEDQKKYFNDYYDADDKIAESEKWLNHYKDKVKENEDALKKNEELRIASENAKAEAEKYNQQMEDLHPEYSRALSASVQAYKDFKAGKISSEEEIRIHKEYEEVENKHYDLLGKANDASFKADQLKAEIDNDAERRLKVYQEEVKKSENELQDLKNQKQEAYDNYFKAVEKYKEADAKYQDYFGDKKVTVDSEGNVSVEGEQQSNEFSLIEYDSGGNPLWDTKYYVKDNIFSGEPSGPVQSLNPRSTLQMRGRTPASNPDSSQMGDALEEFNNAVSQPVYVQSEN